MNKLESQEQKIIEMRYFENRTQTEIAKEMNISQVQVSRLEKKILLKMRGAMLGG
jgi:RNA polymerase sporulation-specific sigma factor